MLAMTLGMAFGVRRTLWMMAGELTGLGLVATLAIASVAAVMIADPALYRSAKYAGGLYLGYVGLRLWLAAGGPAPAEAGGEPATKARHALALQGFLTALANPKAWLLYASLFPPFVDPALPLAPQLALLLLAMLAIELACLLAYASGGRALRRLVRSPKLSRGVNLFSGAVIIFIGGDVMLSG